MRRIALLLTIGGAAGCQAPPRCLTVDTTIVTVTPLVSRTHITMKVER